MGDPLPPSDSQSHPAANNPSSGPFSDVQSPDNNPAFLEAQQLSGNQSDFNQQVSPMYVSPQHAFAAQMDLSHGQGDARMAPYNMSALANALPQASYRTQQFVQPLQQRPQPSISSPGMTSGLQMGSFPGQQHLHTMQNQAYYLPQQPQLAQYYGGSMPSTQQQQNPSPPVNAMGTYNNTLLMNQQQAPQASSFYYPPQYMQSTQAVANRMLLQRYIASAPSSIDPKLSQAPGPSGVQSSLEASFASQQSFNPATRSNVVRGPPRKPRQSGHAIWIGNLPPQTDLMSLVYHVCKEAPGLDSLFLISKSNCAFANYKDEQTCAAAQQKLHDSKFQSVRLVSRLRKSAVENAAGISAPTGPASSTARSPPAETTQMPAALDEDKTSLVTPQVGGAGHALSTPTDVSQQKDKFYILKSLTVDDLELSVRTGIWATQSHNETVLNKAFQTAENVYLIFSANKSGEYFGYARMVSKINEDPAAAIEFAPKIQATTEIDLPKAIPTDATDFMPRGRIIDDSARGTIFWEVEHDEITPGSGDAGGDISGQDDESQPGTSGTGSADDSSSAQSGATENAESKAWGKPFKLEWLSVTRLPFYRTRGLRNPWNSNREVKIARDGTELEPSVGRKLIGLFNRVQDPAPGPALVGIGLPGSGPRPPPGGVGMMPGYPMAMRPPYQQ